jgi:beta-1,4-mannooligosaccharide/beta-1,4-mannosyl-N-acetylglucosamine phosphorylase
MAKRFRKDVVHRWEGNPIISFDTLDFPINNIYSAAAVKKDGIYILLVTMEDLEGKTNIHKALSDDGYHFEVIDSPLMSPSSQGPLSRFEERGVRDARITFLEGRYYIVYIGINHYGSILCLSLTDDFETVERLGIISEPDNKTAALFSCKFHGCYARLERPREGSRIWISYSRDLMTWGDADVVISPRAGFWDSAYVGCSFPPMEIPQGWLMGYYGIRQTSAGPITRLGAAILDRNNPCKVIARSNIPISSPRKEYERIGDVNNIVYSSGAVLEEDGELKIYYAAADNCLCVGTAHLSEIVNSCQESGKEY